MLKDFANLRKIFGVLLFIILTGIIVIVIIQYCWACAIGEESAAVLKLGDIMLCNIILVGVSNGNNSGHHS